ncbi:TPA: polyphosphate polymerase domain-containing protein [Streptococcus suis]
MKTTISQKQFKRRETKYILSKATWRLFFRDAQPHLLADDYAHSTITSIYFDNEDFDMVQDALAKKYQREKVRIRLYDAHPHANSTAFLEIKKKIDGIGYKYRLESTPRIIQYFLRTGLRDSSLTDQPVCQEIQSLRKRYGNLYPKILIRYERQSFKGLEDPKLRLTIDQNVTYSDQHPALKSAAKEKVLLDPDLMIMEIKAAETIPDWLSALLEKHAIERKPFSKYGTAYRLATSPEKELIAYAPIR